MADEANKYSRLGRSEKRLTYADPCHRVDENAGGAYSNGYLRTRPLRLVKSLRNVVTSGEGLKKTFTEKVHRAQCPENACQFPFLDLAVFTDF